MYQSLRIALLLRLYYGYNRMLWDGVQAFARAQKRWYVRWFGSPAAPSTKLLQAIAQWKPHGLLMTPESAAQVRSVRRLGIPLVFITSWEWRPAVPRVDSDDVAVGEVAAEHFIERGFRHVGYLGLDKPASRRREEGLRRRAEAAGLSFRSLQLPSHIGSGSSPSSETKVQRWVADLPDQTGVLAFSDPWALEIEDICRQIGRTVPDDIAVLGVDNDPVICETAPVPISSVRNAATQTGFEAIKLLDRLMRGKPAPKKPILLPPHGIATRASTDVLATDDTDLARAVRYIRRHAAEAIGVADIARQTAIGRRTLERRFRETLGRSIYDEVLHARIELAKGLLVETDLKLLTLARQCGFRSASHLCNTFRKATGSSPAAYRQQMRPTL